MNNAEYLLEYIIEMLKAVEAKGGKAEELLTEYLGQENSQLFLHELCSWMRSPYQNLDDWDRAVQYAVRPLSFERPREPRSLEAKPRNPLLLSELGGP
jgi:regulator of sirC expression with transglutaminase-like and TPR domain